MKKVLLITALVFGLGVAGFAVPFSGEWATDVTIKTPQTPTFTISSTLTVNYEIGGWTFGSISRLRDGGAWTGWDRQDFIADGAIGAFEFTNRLRFVPVTPAFTFLRSTAAVSIAGVDLSSRFLIISDGIGVRLGFGAPVDELTFAATAYLGSLAFDPPTWDPWRVGDATLTPEFRGLDVDITMPFYSTELTIDIDFVPVAAGFQDIRFDVPAFPLGIPGFTLDLSVEYTLEKQTVTVTPAITLVDWVHFQPFITVDGLIDGLVFEGLRLVWDVTEAVRFRYFWDAHKGSPFVVPRIGEVQFRQMVELRYSEAPITLTMAGRWDPGIDTVPLSSVPDRIDVDLAVDILPGFAVRTGAVFGYPSTIATFHAVSFGFTVTW